MRALLPVLTAFALLTGCSNRERANPLDPANPQTGGRPQGFNAVAGYTVVSLEWTPQPSLAIDGFLLQRLAQGDSLYRTVGAVFPPEVSRCTDLLVRNGSLYRYRLSYVIRGAPARLPAEDQATPGPLRPWLADAGAGALLRLSPDGRDVISSSTDAGDVQSLAVDRSSGRVWSSARYAGLVTTRLSGGLSPVSIPGLGQPFSLAVSPLDHGAWICELGGSLAHYAADGTPLAPGRVTLLDTPSGVAVSPRDFSVWVCENGANRARHLNSAGSPIAVAYLPAPSRVAMDSLSGEAWITSLSAGRVWRVSALGARLDSSSAAAGPIGIAVDPRRGNVWIADAAGDRVVVLDLATMALRFTVPGLAGARDVDVDLDTGEAWVVANGSGEVVRVSGAGVVLSRLGGFTSPTEVRLDPGL